MEHLLCMFDIMLDLFESAANKDGRTAPPPQRAYIPVGEKTHNNSNYEAVIMKPQKFLNCSTYKIAISALRETDC